jgi:osmotically-inducible protein OsmY
MDSAIKEDVVRRLTRSPGVRCDGLVVQVAGGTVTLHGRVASWNELQYSTLLAGEVRGVQHVNNRMEISFREPRTNQENLDEIVAAIERDPYLTGLPITVRVSDTVATLEGTVGNAYEKERAEDDARTVSSVTSVKNRLEIKWREEEGVREDLPVMSDGQILGALRASLNQDPRITNPDDITIEVADREVTLAGSVPDYYQDTVARQNARDTVGVTQVFDSLDVDPTDRNDDEILSELAIRLDTDYALADRGIKAYVEDGIATLEGQVQNPFERDHAEYIATTVLGVRRVVNDIVVQPVVGYSDETLKERIEGRLDTNWKTRYVAPRIHVTVEDGSATLTGEVDTWAERLEAGQMSRSVEGVTDVTNNLMLAGH